MATKTNSTIVAVFQNRSDAEAAASDLKANGFSSSDIYVSSDSSTVDAARQPGASYSDASAHSHQHEGGIVGWFKSVFGADEHEDRPYYEDAVNSGHTFLSVDTTDESVDRAASILNGHSPVDVHEEGSGVDTSRTGDPLTKAPMTGAVPAYGAGTAAGSRAADTMPGKAARGNENEVIPVVQEELKVGKRAVMKGGVRVYSRIVEQPVEETVRLHEEKVRVDRTPVNREATAADLRPGQEQVFEVKEYGEEAVVAKTARVVEEVRVRKDATDRTETVRDSVRHTEVNVENVAAGSQTRATGSSAGTALGANEEDFRRNFTTTYGTGGDTYETYAPSYNYGYQMASDPRYQGRSFDQIEPDLKSDYAKQYPNSTWERMKDSVRYGWDKVTRKI